MKRIMLSLIIGSLAISPAFAESRNQEQQSDNLQMHQDAETQEHSRTSDGEPPQWQPEGAPGAYGHIPVGPDRQNQEGDMNNDRPTQEEIDAQEHSRTSDGEAPQWQSEGAPGAYGHIPVGPDRETREGEMENDQRPHEGYSGSDQEQQNQDEVREDHLRDSNAQDSEHGIQGGADRHDNDIGRSTTRIHRDTGE
ncbi:hypothetical protein SAMN05660653_01599 [Desulfonatronum thiosulfatophilum]|uniref:Secreted protein n=1 Tax=Desulfonatronum thiosulfatophilum TaxID=617002 RepID=A0A1G6CKF5_9BACT|nr:hypothetical protein [Desulfonatronum thiosulfatophilum]SDB33388.1 hypothetical protein SAMN05660653_01599 [Desulfonatronum thiosulfatophilum]